MTRTTTPAKPLPDLDTLPLEKLSKALGVLCEVTENDNLQAQAALVFLCVASRHPAEVSLGEVEQVLSLSQSTASRNLGYMSRGNAKMETGWGLLDVYEDPFYRRRKLAKLTPKGHRAAERIARALR